MAVSQQNVEAAPFEHLLRQHLGHDLLRFTTAGSVDDGKSTLIGRLLYDSKAVYEDQMQAVRSGRLNRSTGPLDFSLLTDGLRAEREQGITIDVAYRYFSTARRKFIIADTPGHEQYTRNMATGASTADAAVVLVDARKGLLPQSRRHAYIASLLGIPHIVAAINKMDLVDYSEQIFHGLQNDLQTLAKQIRPEAALSIQCIPISALEGDNVVTHSQRMPWYSGPTLVEYLEQVPVTRLKDSAAFRFPVQYVIRPGDEFRGFAGQIASGSVRPGDAVMVLPSRQTTRVQSIVTFDGELPVAAEGASITLTLEDEIDLSRGDVLVDPERPPQVSRRFAANVVWMHEVPLELHKQWLLKHTTRQVRAEAHRIRSRVDVITMQHSSATALGLNDIGVVEFESTSPLFFDLYAENRIAGSFILIDPLTNATVGAGMITRNLAQKKAVATSQLPSALTAEEMTSLPRLVTAAERFQKQGHAPAAIWLGTQASLAQRLERILFDSGHNALWVEDKDRDLLSTRDCVRTLYVAGIVALYTAAHHAEHEPSHLPAIIHATLQSAHVLDARHVLDAAPSQPDASDDDAWLQSPAVRSILNWIEGLRISSPERYS